MAEQQELKVGDRVEFTDQQGKKGHGIVTRVTHGMTLIAPDPKCGQVTHMRGIKKVG